MMAGKAGVSVLTACVACSLALTLRAVRKN
jgi:hypothetical protein